MRALAAGLATRPTASAAAMPAPRATVGPSAIGLCAAAFGDLPLSAALPAIRDLGHVLIDLPTDSTLRSLPGIDELEDPGFAQELAATLARHDVTVGCVSNSRDTQLLLGPHGPHTDPVHAGDPAAKRAHALRYGHATIALAAALGSPLVRLYFGCPDYARWLTWGSAPVSWQDNIEEFAAVAEPLLDRCRDAGPILCVEPHPKQVLFDRHSVDAALDRLAGHADVLRICLDPANLATLGYDPIDLMRGWRGLPVALHVKDLEVSTAAAWPRGPGWVSYGPQRPIRFRALGRGTLPWPAMLDALLAEGFTGTVFIEHEDVLLPRAQSIAEATSRLRALLPVSQPEGRTW
jgi:sugar phosphate isomerase/epimerase